MDNQQGRGGQQKPLYMKRSEAHRPAHNIDTGPPIRASDPTLQSNYPTQGGGQNQYPQNQTTFSNVSPRYQGQQNQPNQWQGSGYNQYPNQQGYAQGGPGYNRGQQPQQYPSGGVSYQTQQPSNYPPTSYAGGNQQRYNSQYGGVNQSQQPQSPRQQGQQSNSPRASRRNPQNLGQPTPIPRRNSGGNLETHNRQLSEVQENVLLQDINKDIKEAAQYVIHEGEEAIANEAPFDPNLICPLCMRNFRVGEIQKYRKHVNSCSGQ